MNPINWINGPPLLRRGIPATLEEKLQALSPEEREAIQILSDRLARLDMQDEKRIRDEYQEKLLFIPQHLRGEIVEALAQAPLNRLSEIHPDPFFQREARKILMIFLTDFLQEQHLSDAEKAEFYHLMIPCLKYAPQIFDSHYRTGLDHLRSLPRAEREARLSRADALMQLQQSNDGDLFIEYLNAPLQVRVFGQGMPDDHPAVALLHVYRHRALEPRTHKRKNQI